MSPILGIWASQISGHLWSPAGAYDALATVTVPSGGAASVTFAGIPQGYKHLQIRGISKSTNTGTQPVVWLNFNGDTGANYTRHEVIGYNSAASSYGAGNNTWAGYFISTGTTGLYDANIFGAGIIDILDYANTSKNKTIKSLTGMDTNNIYGYVGLTSGVWLNTSAITSITLTSSASANIAQYSSFALYGIK